MPSRVLVTAFSPDDEADKIAAYLPGDRLWAAKHIVGSNTRKLLRALGTELGRFGQTVNLFLQEYDPRTTTMLLSEWETAIGLPLVGIDPTLLTLAQRRGLVVAFLSSTFQTQADFTRLANLLGVPISFLTGAQAYGLPWTLPAPLFSASALRFIQVIVINRPAPASLANQTVITPAQHAAATDAPYDEKVLVQLVLSLLQSQCLLVLRYQ